MKIVNYFLVTALFVCPFFSPVLAGENFTVLYDIEEPYAEIDTTVKKTLNEVMNKDGTKLPFIYLNIGIGNNYETQSNTNAQNNNCKINIAYKEKKPLLLTNFIEDIRFVLLHEIGHCILGKEIFYKDSIDWIDSIKNKDELNKKINYQTSLSIATLECSKCSNKKFKIAPPIAIYHEIYSDIYALMWMTHTNKNLNEVLELSRKRIDSFNENPLSGFYASGLSIPKFLDYVAYSNFSNDLQAVEKISQEGFAQYLNLIYEEYLHKLPKKGK